MSWIKRCIDHACEEIANDTGYSWDDIMDAAIEVDFDMTLVDQLAHSYQLNSFIQTRRKKVMTEVAKNNATVNEAKEEKKGVGLASPWVIFYKEIEALFAKDPDVDVIFNEKNPEIKILVNDEIKADAISKIFPHHKTLGNVEVKITVVPANETEETTLDIFRKAFYGNPAVDSFVSVPTIYGAPMNYLLFVPEVVQFWADNLGNPHGVESMLYETIAKDIFENPDMIFSTAVIEEE
jgi:hypothetical protein